MAMGQEYVLVTHERWKTVDNLCCGVEYQVLPGQEAEGIQVKTIIQTIPGSVPGQTWQRCRGKPRKQPAAVTQ